MIFSAPYLYGNHHLFLEVALQSMALPGGESQQSAVTVHLPSAVFFFIPTAVQ